MPQDPENRSRDRILGMDKPISRRDFVNGMAVGLAAAGAGCLSPAGARADAGVRGHPGVQDLPGYYPPLLQGMRGSHPGSFEGAHALRDGRAPDMPADTREEYDLIVVGGGISGLSAAHFHRQRRGSRGRILILDNHDDFGGHAKRNEFRLAGRTALMNGGTLLIDSPRPYGPVAAG